MKPKIYMIGVYHAFGKKILKHAEDLHPEAIFIEKFKTGARSIGAKKLALAALRNPTFLLGLSIYLAILGIISSVMWITIGEFGPADMIYSKRASKKLGISGPYKIDDDIYEMTVSRRTRWTPISWVIFSLILVCLFLPISIFLRVFGPVLLSLSFLLIFAEFGISTRNKNMMDRMENIIKSGAYKKVFFLLSVPVFQRAISVLTR